MTERDENGVNRSDVAGDVFYEALMKAHEGLTFEESTRLNARLVLILADRIGNLDVLRAALARAGADLGREKRKS